MSSYLQLLAYTDAPVSAHTVDQLSHALLRALEAGRVAPFIQHAVTRQYLTAPVELRSHESVRLDEFEDFAGEMCHHAGAGSPHPGSAHGHGQWYEVMLMLKSRRNALVPRTAVARTLVIAAELTAAWLPGARLLYGMPDDPASYRVLDAKERERLGTPVTYLRAGP